MLAIAPALLIHFATLDAAHSVLLLTKKRLEDTEQFPNGRQILSYHKPQRRRQTVQLLSVLRLWALAGLCAPYKVQDNPLQWQWTQIVPDATTRMPEAGKTDGVRNSLHAETARWKECLGIVFRPWNRVSGGDLGARTFSLQLPAALPQLRPTLGATCALELKGQ